MLKNYRIIKKDDCYLLRRITYPRCKILVGLGRSVPEIYSIKFFDDCSASEIAEVIKEIGSLLASFTAE